MSEVSSPAVMLLGPPGSGKTYSLSTLAADPRVEKLICIFTDPGGDESLLDGLMRHGVDISKVHWKHIPAAAASWGTVREMGDKIRMFDYEGLTKLKSGIGKKDHGQFFDLVEAFEDFTCQRTGQNLGAVDKFPESWAVAYDSITGLNKLTRELTVGAKPALHQGEWGTAMALEDAFVQKFVNGIKCPRVIIAHLDQSRDELTGRTSFVPSFLGSKLGPNMPSLFSDAIFTYTEGGKFYWSTVDDRIALKTRNLPLQQKIQPDFKQILDSWEKRKKYTQEHSDANQASEPEV